MFTSSGTFVLPFKPREGSSSRQITDEDGLRVNWPLSSSIAISISSCKRVFTFAILCLLGVANVLTGSSDKVKFTGRAAWS